MNIIKVNREVVQVPEQSINNEIWVRWEDVKKILEEYKDSIEDECYGISDSNLFINIHD